MYKTSITAANPLPIIFPTGPNTVNNATFAKKIVIVGTNTNDTTAGTYFCAIFSTLDINHAGKIAGNTPPWNATFAIANGPKCQ